MTTAESNRYEIVQKGNGLIWVRLVNPIQGCSMMVGSTFFNTVEEARRLIKSEIKRCKEERLANSETVLEVVIPA